MTTTTPSPPDWRSVFLRRRRRRKKMRKSAPSSFARRRRRKQKPVLRSNDSPKTGKKRTKTKRARTPSIGNFLFQFPSIPSAQHNTFGKREREQKKKKLKTKITHQRGGVVVRELARDAKHFGCFCVSICVLLISVSRVSLRVTCPKIEASFFLEKKKRPKNDERHPSTFSSSPN